MFFKHEYKYLVFYFHTDKNMFGFGSIEIARNKKLKDGTDIIDINQYISKQIGKECTIINYKRI